MMCREFTDALIVEEQRIDRLSSTSNRGKLQLSTITEENWTVGRFWYTRALASPIGIFCSGLQANLTGFSSIAQSIILSNELCRGTGHKTVLRLQPTNYCMGQEKNMTDNLNERLKLMLSLNNQFPASFFVDV
jgi:hypothetical protein